MSYEYELEKARTQQAGHNSPESQYLITDFDTWVANPFWDGVKEMDLSEPEVLCKLCESSGEDLTEDGLCPSCQRQEERINNGTLVWWSGMLGE